MAVDRASSWSRRLERWEDAPRCRQVASFEGVIHLAAVIVVADSDEEVPSLRLDEVGGRVIVRTTVNGYERVIALTLTGAPVVDLGSEEGPSPLAAWDSRARTGTDQGRIIRIQIVISCRGGRKRRFGVGVHHEGEPGAERPDQQVLLDPDRSTETAEDVEDEGEHDGEERAKGEGPPPART